MRPDTTHNPVARRILLQNFDQTAHFIHEWNSSQGEEWMAEIHPSIEVIATAYSEELQRRLRGKTGDEEWKQIIESVRLLTYSTMEWLLQLKPELAQEPFYFDPQSLEQKAHRLLTSAAYQFGITLRELERALPAVKRIAAEVVQS